MSGVKVTRTGELPTQLWDAPANREAGTVLLEAIDERVFVRGHDVNDQPFRPYSAGYAAELQRRGESPRVDLNRSGRLRAAIARSVATVTAEGATLIPPPEVLQQAQELQHLRAFWGIARSDEARLAAHVESIAQRAMDRGRR